MNNERRKVLKEVLANLQQFVDGNVPESKALEFLSDSKETLSECLFDEQDSRDNIVTFVTESGPKVDRANRLVDALEDADDDIEAVCKHLKDNDAEYLGLINVYIKSAIENIKKAIGK